VPSSGCRVYLLIIIVAATASVVFLAKSLVSRLVLSDQFQVLRIPKALHAPCIFHPPCRTVYLAIANSCPTDITGQAKHEGSSFPQVRQGVSEVGAIARQGQWRW
jgi:hypothetical protein